MILEKKNFKDSSDYAIDKTIPHKIEINLTDRIARIELNGKADTKQTNAKNALESKGFTQL